ncbi:MAG TPA: alpha-E domain-containing protein, partial [Opitutaceae bacterium]|nr:alpha-E domain-containing protein [Opitutaceae bacterium]
SSQDAYRRLYQTRAEPLLITDLFLRNSDAPRSLRYCLLEIEAALDDLQAAAEFSTVALGGPEATLVSVMVYLNEVRLRLTDPKTTSPSAKKEESPAALLTELLSRLYNLSQIISDYYFSHQARISEPVTGDDEKDSEKK